MGARFWGGAWGAKFLEVDRWGEVVGLLLGCDVAGVDRGSKVAGVELGVAKSLELKVGAKSLGMSVGCDTGRGVAGLVLGTRMC